MAAPALVVQHPIRARAHRALLELIVSQPMSTRVFQTPVLMGGHATLYRQQTPSVSAQVASPDRPARIPALRLIPARRRCAKTTASAMSMLLNKRHAFAKLDTLGPRAQQRLAPRTPARIAVCV